MDKDKIFNFVQKAVSTPPLILVGSGGSAPYGLPSMTELGNHLVNSLDIKYKTDYSWNRFYENLSNGQDLETALSDIPLSDGSIEIISYNKMVQDSKMRNKILFDKLFNQ